MGSELAFYIQVYKDKKIASRALSCLRKSYPDERVILLSDGDDDPEWPVIAAAHSAEYVLGERLYQLRHGGMMCQRMFDLLLSQPADFLFKLDTDTIVHRRHKFLPTDSGSFGTIQWNQWPEDEYCSIQGGCQGWTRDAAQAISDSRYLLSQELVDFKQTWAKHHLGYGDKWLLERGLICQDWLLGYVNKKLGIYTFHYDEVNSQWRKPVDNSSLKYAITHPHKLEENVSASNP
jgi:hypothetical protein